MALRAMWGFNHLPQGQVAGTTGGGFGLGYNGYGIGVQGGAFSGIYITGNAICTQGNQYVDANFTIVTNLISDTVSPKSIFGFRLKYATLHALIGIQIGTVLTRFSELGVTGTGESYIEVICDRVTKEISFLVNGVFKLKKVSPAVPMAAGQTISFTAPVGSYNLIYWSDFYYIDDTQDDTPCSRLGPVVVVQLNPNSAVGQDWVSSDGKTLLEDIKAPYVSPASMTAPTITSPTSLTPLEMAFDPIADVNATIIGVGMVLDSMRLPTSQTAVNVSLKNGQAATSLGDLSYANDLLTYQASPVSAKAPDGTAWSFAKLSATKIVLTPKSSI